MEKLLQIAKEKKSFIILGALSGLINGLLGSGGGIIFVAGTTLIMRTEQKKAQASAIPAMLAFSIISAVLYIIRGTPIQTEILIPVVLGSAAGGIAGALLYPVAAVLIFGRPKKRAPATGTPVKTPSDQSEP